MISINGDFYRSKQWRRTRELFLERNPWCEECMKANKYEPATLVHHRVHLNESNVDNPDISLSFDNLEAVCIDCHNKIHLKKNDKRYTVDEWGRVSPLSNTE